MATRGRPQKEWQNQLPPSLFDDTAYCTLGPMHRLLLLALIARADRYGRGMARSSMLRVAAFDGLPVTDDQVPGMLRELVDLMAGSQYELTVYVVDRNPYYAFPRWFEWQNIEYLPKTSRFPAPPDYQDYEPPTPPRGRPDDSADLPPEQTSASATVPTRGETPAADTRGEVPDEERESADLSAVERARRSREYREYEQTCRDGELDRWLAPLAFEQLFGELVRKHIDDWTVLIEVAAEAAKSASGRTPNVRYGVSIIKALPPEVKSRADARAHFEKPRPKPDGGRGGRKPERKSNVFWHGDPLPADYYDGVFKRYDKPGA